MTAALFALLLSALPAQNAPTGLQVEGGTTPVTDHRPDFRATNGFSQTVDRFRIQVSTNATFAPATHWDSGSAGVVFPGGNVAGGGVPTPDLSYGEGAATLLSVPLLDWGTTYNWRTQFRRTNGTWSGFSTTSQFTMASPTRAISQHSINGSPTVDSWRFVSVPINFGSTVPASTLLSSVTSLYRLDEPSRSWVQLGPGDPLEGGKGYLAWSSPNAVLTLSQGKVTAGVPPELFFVWTTTPSYSFPDPSFPAYSFSYTTQVAPAGQEVADTQPANSYRGNHLFGNPFYAPISWRESKLVAPFTLQPGDISRTGISAMMYKYDGTQYLTYNGSTGAGTAGEWIEPFQAVGIVVLDANYTLDVNTPSPPLTGGTQKARTPSLTAAPAAPDPERWHLRIEARSGAGIDTENAFGVDPDSDDAWDVRDSEEPGPGAAAWVLVSFDHRSDWTKYPRKYTHDFKKTPTQAADEVVWTFTVDGNTGLPATLTWPNLADIPADEWKFTLEDPSGPTVVDLSTAASYDTAPVNGPSTLTLRATRLKDAPVAPASGGSGGGGGCGLLGLEGLLLAAGILGFRSRRRA